MPSSNSRRIRVSRPRVEWIAGVALVLVSCGGAAATPTPAPTVASTPTASLAPIPAPTVAVGSAQTPVPGSPGAWQVYDVKDAGFSVRMPGAPVSQTQAVDTALGKIEVHIDLVAAGGGAYGTSWSDYPKGSITDATKSLVGAQAGAIENVKGTLVSEKAIDYKGVPGREFSASIPGGSYRSRLYLFGDRLIQLIVVDPAGAPLDAERFFSSFERAGT